MRHVTITSRELDARDIAAVWPATTEIAPLPVHEEPDDVAPVMSAPAVPDVPAEVGVVMVVSYALLVGLLALATAGSGRSLESIVVVAFFLFMFFAVPAIFLGIERVEKRPSMGRFFEQGMQTLNGHSTAGSALVQMLVVPLSLAFGVILAAVIAVIAL